MLIWDFVREAIMDTNSAWQQPLWPWSANISGLNNYHQACSWNLFQMPQTPIRDSFEESVIQYISPWENHVEYNKRARNSNFTINMRGKSWHSEGTLGLVFLISHHSWYIGDQYPDKGLINPASSIFTFPHARWWDGPSWIHAHHSSTNLPSKWIRTTVVVGSRGTRLK